MCALFLGGVVCVPFLGERGGGRERGVCVVLGEGEAWCVVLFPWRGAWCVFHSWEVWCVCVCVCWERGVCSGRGMCQRALTGANRR